MWKVLFLLMNFGITNISRCPFGVIFLWLNLLGQILPHFSHSCFISITSSSVILSFSTFNFLSTFAKHCNASLYFSTASGLSLRASKITKSPFLASSRTFWHWLPSSDPPKDLAKYCDGAISSHLQSFSLYIYFLFQLYLFLWLLNLYQLFLVLA